MFNVIVNETALSEKAANSKNEQLHQLYNKKRSSKRQKEDSVVLDIKNEYLAGCNPSDGGSIGMQGEIKKQETQLSNLDTQIIEEIKYLMKILQEKSYEQTYIH